MRFCVLLKRDLTLAVGRGNIALWFKSRNDRKDKSPQGIAHPGDSFTWGWPVTLPDYQVKVPQAFTEQVVTAALGIPLKKWTKIEQEPSQYQRPNQYETTTARGGHIRITYNSIFLDGEMVGCDLIEYENQKEMRGTMRYCGYKGVSALYRYIDGNDKDVMEAEAKEEAEIAEQVRQIKQKEAAEKKKIQDKLRRL